MHHVQPAPEVAPKAGAPQVSVLGRTNPLFSPVQIALAAGVVAATLAAHSPVLSARALCLDDDQYVMQNYLVQQPGLYSLYRFAREVTPSTVRGYYQPLTMASLMLDSALGGSPQNRVPYHRSNWILHAVNTGLLALLMQRLFGNPWVAAALGLLFGTHPLTVQTVAWIGERKTLLSTSLALCSVLLYIRYVRSMCWWGYLGALAAYGLAMLAKPIALPLAFLLLVLDYWPLQRLNWQALREKKLFYLAALIFVLVTIRSQGESASINAEPGREASVLILRAVYVSGLYLGKMLWPVNVSGFYLVPEPVSLSNPAVLSVVLGVTFLSVILIASVRYTRSLASGAAWYLLALLPTLGFVGYTWVQSAEKYAYFPAIGLLLALAGLLASGWRKMPALARGASIAVLVALAAAQNSSTQRHLRIWQQNVSLSKHLLTFMPQSPQLHVGMGEALYAEGRLPEAAEWYQQALQLNPRMYEGWKGLGDVLADQGQTHQSITAYRQALRMRRNSPAALSSLAQLLAMRAPAQPENIAEATAAAERACVLTHYYDPAALDALAATRAAAKRLETSAARSRS